MAYGICFSLIALLIAVLLPLATPLRDSLSARGGAGGAVRMRRGAGRIETVRYINRDKREVSWPIKLLKP